MLIDVFSPFHCAVQIWGEGRLLSLRVQDLDGRTVMHLSSLQLPRLEDATAVNRLATNLRAICPDQS